MSDGAYRSAILLTDDPGERHWGLGAFPTGDGLGVMVGWTVESPEGGVPTSVARVLVRAMARYGRITFPFSAGPAGDGDSWRMRGDDAVARPAIATQGFWRRLLSGGSSTTIPLLSTRREDAALDLFEDPFFQWWNASQFVLVSRPPEVPPPLASPLPSELFEENWPNAIPLLQAAGVEIIIRSGVDGDVCGLAFLASSTRSEFEGMLDMAAAECGLIVHTVSNKAFGEILSEALNLSN
jgi:hypothetical protein